MQNLDFISENIKRILKEKGYSMAKAERIIGMSGNQLSHYCSGKYYPTVWTLCNMAEDLEVDVREFFRPLEER